jgi:hypothetical protein
MALHGILGFARPFLFWHSAKKHIITIKRHYLYCDDKIGHTSPLLGASTPPHSLSSARFHEPAPDSSHPSIPNTPIVYWMILLCLSGAAASHTHFSLCVYIRLTNLFIPFWSFGNTLSYGGKLGRAGIRERPFRWRHPLCLPHSF